MTKASTAMRRLVEGDEIFVRPGCHDALSARIAEAAGFKAIAMSGYAVSVSLLGKPDVGLITLTETVRMCRYICNAVEIPVMVDADTGYGNAINVMRTVDEIINAGAGGLFIEDQVDPKRCGHVAGKQLVSIEEAAGKIRAADKVRREMDPDVILMARTDGRGALGGSFQESLDRAKAYADAGADIIFPEGLISEEEIAAMVEALDVPISYNRTGVSPMLSLVELEKLGVRMVANAIGAFRASSRALWDHLGEADGPPAQINPKAQLERFLQAAD
ncbi:MAG: isocitrate lyase/PEP mutase family protein [Alphaproteobacteria bacterium]|jgi:2-methylisocitrate lyase-like PEP mutase family enzyme|nr:isocitrate lyase/PEP mutase family protein [Alphaproteobacteria bacterium]MDP6872155.1 isocitrate lyase/PEP mutase family protein [Alphaproteobacteria bacterium]